MCYRLLLLFASLVFVVNTYSDEQDQDRDFNRALSLSQAGMETQSVQSWIDFLRRYPQGTKTDQAYYYLAEVYFRSGKYLEARTELLRVFRFPNSEKTPDAAVLLGEAYQKEKKNSEAKIYWESVLRRFPKSKAAEKAKNLLLSIGVKKS